MINPVSYSPEIASEVHEWSEVIVTYLDSNLPVPLMPLEPLGVLLDDIVLLQRLHHGCIRTNVCHNFWQAQTLDTSLLASESHLWVVMKWGHCISGHTRHVMTIWEWIGTQGDWQAPLLVVLKRAWLGSVGRHWDWEYHEADFICGGTTHMGLGGLLKIFQMNFVSTVFPYWLFRRQGDDPDLPDTGPLCTGLETEAHCRTADDTSMFLKESESSPARGSLSDPKEGAHLLSPSVYCSIDESSSKTPPTCRRQHMMSINFPQL